MYYSRPGGTILVRLTLDFTCLQRYEIVKVEQKYVNLIMIDLKQLVCMVLILSSGHCFHKLGEVV